MSSSSTTNPPSLINGKYADRLDSTDRGLAYGHGLFETIRLCRGKPTLWQEHMDRLLEGCKRLAIDVPDRLVADLADDISALAADDKDGVIKIMVTAGSGGRGYASPSVTHTQRIVRLFPLPEYPADRTEGVRVITCDYQLGVNPRLAGLKHLNRLDQVLARAEWQDTAIAEGILCDQQGYVIEGTMSNIFAVKDEQLLTPKLNQAGVRGVMRDFILRYAAEQGLQVREVMMTVAEFKDCDELFLTNSVIGLWPITEWEGVRYSKGTVTQKIKSRIDQLFIEGV